MADLGEKLEPIARELLAPGEELRGCCVASQQSTFKGRMVAIAVTDGRLVIQGLDRKFGADGDPLSLTPERIAKAKIEGGGGGWMELENIVMDQVGVTLKIRTTDGQKLKLTMMLGEGILGGLGGGEVQRHGLHALGHWFDANA
jgi:hypothetical protein